MSCKNCNGLGYIQGQMHTYETDSRDEVYDAILMARRPCKICQEKQMSYTKEDAFDELSRFILDHKNVTYYWLQQKLYEIENKLLVEKSKDFLNENGR